MLWILHNSAGMITFPPTNGGSYRKRADRLSLFAARLPAVFLVSTILAD
jgi:hypothetical protein